MEETEFSPNDNTFHTKLWQLVNDTDIDAIIWNHQGDGLIISTNLLGKELLSLNGFKVSSFLSFAQQLNLYGFEKSEGFNGDEPNVHHYFHPNFKRNQPELLPLLRRCHQKSTSRVKAELKTDLTERWRDHRDPYDAGDDTRDANLYHGESFTQVILTTLWN